MISDNRQRGRAANVAAAAIRAARRPQWPAVLLPQEFLVAAQDGRWPLAQMIAMVERGYARDESLQKLAQQAAAPETTTAQAAALWSQIVAAMMKHGHTRTHMRVARRSRPLFTVIRFLARQLVFIIAGLATAYAMFYGLARLAPERPLTPPNVMDYFYTVLARFGEDSAMWMAAGLRAFGLTVNSPWAAAVLAFAAWPALVMIRSLTESFQWRWVPIKDAHWTTLVTVVGRQNCDRWEVTRNESPAQPDRQHVPAVGPVAESNAAQRIAVVRAALEQLGREWGEYELDLDAYCLTKTALRNADEPYTAAYTHAYEDLVLATDQLGGSGTDESVIAAAEAAAEKALAAWAEADAHALTVGNTDLDLIEQAALRRLFKQVSMLADEATPQASWPQWRDAIDREIAKIATVPIRRQALVRYLELEAPGRLRAIESADRQERETA